MKGHQNRQQRLRDEAIRAGHGRWWGHSRLGSDFYGRPDTMHFHPAGILGSRALCGAWFGQQHRSGWRWTTVPRCRKCEAILARALEVSHV